NVTSVSRRLNAAYSVGRYAICSATTTRPVPAAANSTAVASGVVAVLLPRVNTDEPLSWNAWYGVVPCAPANISTNPPRKQSTQTASSSTSAAGPWPTRIASLVSYLSNRPATPSNALRTTHVTQAVSRDARPRGMTSVRSTLD